MAKKNYVLDTNVILHEYKCIQNFEDNDLFVPITVLEELDRFKKGSEEIHFNARAFTRLLDEKASGALLTDGVVINEDGGRLSILTEGLFDPRVKAAFVGDRADHRILSAALTLADKDKTKPTILVTKDVNLRIKALSLGMKAEDYTSDKIADTNTFSGLHCEVGGISPDIIDSIYKEKNEGVSLSDLSLPFDPIPNQTFILNSGQNSVLARVSADKETVHAVEKKTLSGITPRNAEQTFAFEVLTDPDISLIALTGTAGTGKTLLALAAALSMIDEYQHIYLARPIVSLANKDLGFLPGDYKQKVQPYMQPLFDNLNVIKAQLAGNHTRLREIDAMLTDEKLIIEALAYIRGRSLANVICIVDESQNLTPQEIKTIITRAGENAKMIFTGDIYQIDSPYLDSRSNGLAYMIERMKGEDFFAHVNLVQGERSRLSDIAAKKL
ncbi:PhoH family protein [Porphyromonas sp.]|uniref:PhoH family protein n=1 Tax=Porphyromonas sp. TaxID=1924944 RepID=UPI0026DDA013|nr:PhoH family protein [Porphyromonas sp.]MDO4770396.1 PhoH family protein [Porphyromonas sp.]